EPVHVAMGALAQERFETRLGAHERVGPRHTDRVETMRTRGLGKPGLDLDRIAQKSRSAYVADGGTPGCVSPRIGRNDGRDLIRAYQFLASWSSLHGPSPR